MNPFSFDTSYTKLPSCFYTYSQPKTVRAPKLLLFNQSLAESLSIPQDAFTEDQWADWLSGNRQIPRSDPLSQAYAGHQFGHFTMLGDGRAHLLGEHELPSGERVDIQLKGSGRSNYSRNGDGNAALGPMLREYLISEAIHALGIPTTRSLAVVSTGEDVYRQEMLPGAILTRVASSHIRIGTFQYAAALKNHQWLQELLNYSVSRHFPEIQNSRNIASEFLYKVMEKQINLIIDWMRVGFVHGVMNTDNMAISGETIDYGPCAFMDHFNSNAVYSSIDYQSRYSYSNQAPMAQWNLTRLAEALLPLIDDNTEVAIEKAKEIISQFTVLYEAGWYQMMCQKLGITAYKPEYKKIISDLCAWMESGEIDYTYFFYLLTYNEKELLESYHQVENEHWYQSRNLLIKDSYEDSKSLMKTMNPVIIPRNFRVESALNEASNNSDLRPFNELLNALQTPYSDSSEKEEFKKIPTPKESEYITYCGT